MEPNVEMNAEAIGRPLTQTETAHVANLCRKRKLVTGIAAYLYFSLGLVKIEDTEAFLNDPRYLPVINRAVLECWKFCCTDVVSTPAFEEFLRGITAHTTLKVEQVDVLFEEFSKPSAISQLN